MDDLLGDFILESADASIDSDIYTIDPSLVQQNIISQTVSHAIWWLFRKLILWSQVCDRGF